MATILVVTLGSGLVCGTLRAFATPSGSTSASDKIILRLGWTGEPDSLNPFVGISASDYEVWHLQYDLLTGYDAALKPKPEFARSWSHSKDGLTWTFKTRRGMTWQDGRPATAHDVAFTFSYIIRNQMSAFSGYTEGIKKVVAVDDTTVVFHCSRPKANILGMWVPILPERVWSKVDPKLAASSYPNRAPIVGSGPFQVVKWKRGSFIQLEANPTYWAGRPAVDEVLFVSYQNAGSMAQDVKNGSLAGAWGIPPAQVRSLNGNGISSISYVTPGFDHLTFNCAPAPATGNPVLRNPAFRGALNYAIDKDKIAAVCYAGQTSPATSIISAGFYGSDLDYHWEPSASEKYTFDLKKAEAALDAAGYRDTDGDGVREDKRGKPIGLELLAPSEVVTGQNCGRLIATWFRDIGLKIEYEVVGSAALSDRVWNMVDGKVEPDFDMFIGGWTGDVDPNFLVSTCTSEQIGMWNRSAWSNAAYDRLFVAQTHELDPQRRKQTICRMQKIVYGQSPLIPLVYLRWREAYDIRHWTGWVESPAKDGGAFFTFQTDSYLRVHPTSAGGGDPAGTSPWKVAVPLAAIVSLLAVWLTRRRRSRAAVEAEQPR